MHPVYILLVGVVYPILTPHPYSTNVVEEVDTITNKSDSCTPTSDTIKVNDLSL